MSTRHQELKDYVVENPCLKQTVKALIVTNTGDEVFGSNHINNKEIKECPRVTQNFKTGEGYHLCKEVCKQGSHAEVDAIKNAKKMGLDLKGATLYLSGHTYCCDDCIRNMKMEGIKKAFVFDDVGVCKEYNL